MSKKTIAAPKKKVNESILIQEPIVVPLPKEQPLLLTISQIDEICALIPLNRGLPVKVAESIVEKIRNKLSFDLKTVRIYPKKFDAFKAEILKYYYTTLAQAGEAVGIITAQSIGERQTQTTLNSFHSAGLTIKTVITGVPRFSELLNATKDPKMVNCLIHMTETFHTIPDIRKRIGNTFVDVNLKRIVLDYDLIKDPLEDWHFLFCSIYDIDYQRLGWRIRFYLDITKIYEYEISMKLIKKKIESQFENMTVLYTPEWKGILDVFIDEFQHMDPEEEEEIEADVEVDVDIVESEEEEENQEDDEYVIEEDKGEEKSDNEQDAKPVNLVKTYEDEPTEIPDDIEKIIQIEDKILPVLLTINISGISNINEIFFEKRKDEWVVTTEGSNLLGLFEDPLVDKKKTLCNNMWEIYHVFGIEAARQFLIEEFMDVVSSDGTFVNSSHVELLVDMMVFTGSIISISRYGQKKVGSGPISRASFEESLENFLKAGLNGDLETTKGVSASIMLGKLPETGTGVFDLVMNMSQLLKTSPPPPIDVSIHVPIDVSIHVPIDVPIDVSIHVPIDVPKDVPIHVPIDVPIHVTKDVPKETKRSIFKSNDVVEKDIPLPTPPIAKKSIFKKTTFAEKDESPPSLPPSLTKKTELKKSNKKNSFFSD